MSLLKRVKKMKYEKSELITEIDKIVKDVQNIGDLIQELAKDKKVGEMFIKHLENRNEK
jgi:phosphate uptake regulator